MAYMCIKGYGECDACGACEEEKEEYIPEYYPEEDD